MQTSIFEIAKRCGVSPGIVSRVLGTYRSEISDETRDLVLRTARELSYEPSPHTHKLGVLFMDESAKGLTHPFFASVLDAFKIAAEERGYDVTFINQRIGGQELSYTAYSQYRNLAGVCIACVDFTDPQVSELVASGIPCVTVDHLFKKTPAVISDNEMGVQKLVEYAISMGHQKIAFIHGHNNSVVTRTRIKQFYQTMEFYKLPVPEEYVRAGLYSDIGLARKLVLELLDLEDRPGCILLPDDLCYFGAQEAAAARGLKIPQDISFMGYDGISITQAIHPRLTTIRQRSEKIGEAAATRLINMIENPAEKSRVPTIVPTELIEGESVSNRK